MVMQLKYLVAVSRRNTRTMQNSVAQRDTLQNSRVQDRGTHYPTPNTPEQNIIKQDIRTSQRINNVTTNHITSNHTTESMGRTYVFL